jgi:ABC-type polysaccharide/polyol phosphate export permease
MSQSKRTVTVYEPSTTGVPALGPYLEEVWSRRSLVWHLARTSMKARHYDTAMGKAWLVVDPIVMAFTFYLVRVVFRPGGSTDSAGFFIAHIIMGISFFYYVRAIVEGGSRCILGNRSLVLNTAAPLGIFPAVVLVRAVLELIPTMGVYFGVHLLTGQPWGFSLLLLPFVLVLLTLFALGLGLFFAPMVVFYRDTGTLLPYVIRIWLYITPVMYAVDEIPAAVKPFLILNPLYPFFYLLEAIFKAQWPPIGYWAWSAAWALVAMVVGVIAFTRREREYAVRL